jgi:23S rRNA (cytosine1962-C5)-methyltransferase
VASLDASQPALTASEANFRLNPAVRLQPETICGDAFAVLQEMGGNGRQFDLIIIDPPALAKSQAEIERALAAYRRLVRLGLAVAAPQAVFVMASCSSRITADQFFDLVHETARGMGRPLRELARTGHAADHPIGFPEGAYLKCLFSRLVV